MSGIAPSPPPLPQTPLVDANGYASHVWVRFFMLLWRNAISSSTTGKGNVGVITPTSSPFVFTSSAPGTVLISGGGIENVEFSRDGTTYYSAGTFRGSIPVASGDAVRVTYLPGNAPTMLFIPM